MNLISPILDLIFPPKCVFCARIMAGDGLRICPDCQQKLPWLEGEAAGKTVEFTSKCVSALRYQGKAAEGIHRYKFSGRESSCTVFGVLLSQVVDDHLKGQFDVITWVPVSRQRRRERGYDQSFLLARELGRILNRKPVGLLRKTKHLQPQSRLNGAAERRANVMGAYCVPRPERVQGKRVLLVDDVVTTGATLSECARTLLLAGAEAVVCITLAKAG